ncbi:unnamed protein product [Diplocarpon coronariae]
MQVEPASGAVQCRARGGQSDEAWRRGGGRGGYSIAYIGTELLLHQAGARATGQQPAPVGWPDGRDIMQHMHSPTRLSRGMSSQADANGRGASASTHRSSCRGGEARKLHGETAFFAGNLEPGDRTWLRNEFLSLLGVGLVAYQLPELDLLAPARPLTPHPDELAPLRPRAPTFKFGSDSYDAQHQDKAGSKKGRAGEGRERQGKPCLILAVQTRSPKCKQGHGRATQQQASLHRPAPQHINTPSPKGSLRSPRPESKTTDPMRAFENVRASDRGAMAAARGLGYTRLYGTRVHTVQQTRSDFEFPMLAAADTTMLDAPSSVSS